MARTELSDPTTAAEHRHLVTDPSVSVARIARMSLVIAASFCLIQFRLKYHWSVCRFIDRPSSSSSRSARSIMTLDASPGSSTRPVGSVDKGADQRRSQMIDCAPPRGNADSTLRRSSPDHPFDASTMRSAAPSSRLSCVARRSVFLLCRNSSRQLPAAAEPVGYLKRPRHQLLHDLRGAGVDAVHARVRIGARDRILRM